MKKLSASIKKLVSGLLLVATTSSFTLLAETPKATLEVTVNQLLEAVSDKQKSDDEQRAAVDAVIQANVDFDAVSKRVVSKPWKKASEQQQTLFKKQFAKIMVDTYFGLLQNYTNEKVLYGKEQIKKNKYATVDTKVISKGKTIPVRYRLIKVDEQWKIYDFIVEGVSIINSYKGTYKTILKKKGMEGLLVDMVKLKKNKKD